MNNIELNSDSPKISIITVVYNGADSIEKTIESIIHQTSHDYEYIIIDGASTDNTCNIIRRHEKHISKWISEPDAGLYDAMNKGLLLSTGSYVWFINAGDKIFDREIISKLNRIISAQNPDILYGGTLITDQHGNDIGFRRQKLPENLTWKSLKRGMVVSHQSILVKRSLVPFYDLNYKCSADIDWVISSLKNSKKTVNTYLVLSRFLDGGRSKRTIIPSLKDRFKIMQRYYGLLPALFYHIPIAFRFFSFLLRHRRF